MFVAVVDVVAIVVAVVAAVIVVVVVVVVGAVVVVAVVAGVLFKKVQKIPDRDLGVVVEVFHPFRSRCLFSKLKPERRISSFLFLARIQS